MAYVSFVIFYHGKSAFFTTIWGICFFSTTLSKSQIYMYIYHKNHPFMYENIPYMDPIGLFGG